MLQSSFPVSAQLAMFNLRQHYPIEFQALHTAWKYTNKKNTNLDTALVCWLYFSDCESVKDCESGAFVEL